MLSISLLKRKRLYRVSLAILAVLPFLYYISTLSSISLSYKHRNSLKPVKDNSLSATDSKIEKDPQQQQHCVHSKLQLWHPALKPYFKKPRPLKCDTVERNWVYSANGTFRISKQAAIKHGGIECSVVPILRGVDDFNLTKGNRERFRDGQTLVSDVFEVECSAADGQNMTIALLGVAPNPEVIRKSATVKSLPQSALGLDIIMFGFDSVSRLTWMRNLPKSYKYFVEELGGVVMEGYNIVGDGTPQALLPILTGKTEIELPEARRGFEGAQSVDDHPWIWKDLAKLGYVTQWGEDTAGYGTFTFRMLGFKDQPVDHYMRTFYLKAEQHYKEHQKFCLGSLPRHLNMMNHMKDFLDVYSAQRKFSFIFHAEYTHGGFSELQLADVDLLEHLQYLKDRGHLDNALLVLMADHGARFHELRTTEQGKYEERLPFVGLRLPERFVASHPDVARNLKTNAGRLTTPFDIHATFRDVIDFGGDKSYVGENTTKPLPRGISLFREIPKRRSCSDAGIELHWCGCLSWTVANSSDPMVVRASQSVVDTINDLTLSERNSCDQLTLAQLVQVVRYSANEQLLKFSGTTDQDGRKPEMGDKMNRTEDLYQVTFRTEPGSGIFEATVRHSLDNDTMTADLSAISRINRYGQDPECVAERLPHLRPYCHCRVQLRARGGVKRESMEKNTERRKTSS